MINARFRFKVAGATLDKIPAFRIELPEQAVEILVCAFLPGAIGVGKIDLAVQPFLNSAPVGKFSSTVAGDRLDQLGREGRQRRDNCVLHGLRPSVRHLHGNVKPSLALRQGGETGFAFALAAHHRIRFPVSGFLAAVYRLVPLTDRLSLTVFPSRFFRSMALSLAAQYLQIAVYQVFLVDPPVDGTPAWHLQLTRGTGDLLRRPGRPQFFLYAVNNLLRMEHPSVAEGTTHQILILCCVRVIGRDVVHVRTVSAYLSGHCTDVSADQPGDLAVTQPIHVIFPYTTALFYGKMMVVHTVPSWCFGGMVTPFYHRGLYELSFYLPKVLHLLV